MTRRGVLKAAVIAPSTAALAPLMGQVATRDYVWFRAASFDHYETQSRCMAHSLVRTPRQSCIWTHSTA